MNLVQMKHTGSIKAYVCKFNTKINDTTNIDELAKKLIVLVGVAKLGGGCLVQVPKASWGRGGDHQECESIEANGPKRSWAVPHHKAALAKIGPKEMSASSLAHYTKAKYDRVVDKMLKGGFMLPRQIILVPRTKFWKVALCYQGKSCLCCRHNVRRWFCQVIFVQ